MQYLANVQLLFTSAQMGIISHYIKCYTKNKCLAVINGIGNFKKNRSGDEKNTNGQSFGLKNNPNDWMFILTLSKVRNHPENAKLD